MASIPHVLRETDVCFESRFVKSGFSASKLMILRVRKSLTANRIAIERTKILTRLPQAYFASIEVAKCTRNSEVKLLPLKNSIDLHDDPDTETLIETLSDHILNSRREKEVIEQRLLECWA